MRLLAPLLLFGSGLVSAQESASYKIKGLSITSVAEETSSSSYVHSGTATLRCASGEFLLKSGMYFSAAGAALIHGIGTGQVISQPGYDGLKYMPDFSRNSPEEQRSVAVPEWT